MTILLILLNVEMFFALMATITHAIEVRLDVNEALLRVHWKFLWCKLNFKEKNKCLTIIFYLCGKIKISLCH